MKWKKLHCQEDFMWFFLHRESCKRRFKNVPAYFRELVTQIPVTHCTIEPHFEMFGGKYKNEDPNSEEEIRIP